MLIYKIDILDELKKIGLTQTKIRECGIFSQSSMKKFKNGDTNITLSVLNSLCYVLDMQPRDIIEFIETDEDRKKNSKKQ